MGGDFHPPLLPHIPRLGEPVLLFTGNDISDLELGRRGSMTISLQGKGGERENGGERLSLSSSSSTGFG